MYSSPLVSDSHFSPRTRRTPLGRTSMTVTVILPARLLLWSASAEPLKSRSKFALAFRPMLALPKMLGSGMFSSWSLVILVSALLLARVDSCRVTVNTSPMFSGLGIAIQVVVSGRLEDGAGIRITLHHGLGTHRRVCRVVWQCPGAAHGRAALQNNQHTHQCQGGEPFFLEGVMNDVHGLPDVIGNELEHLIGGGNHLGVHLIRPLGGDHIDQLFHHFNVG